MRLTKFPKGLLELFQLKTLGQAPSQFGEALLPAFDVLPFYSDLATAELSVDVSNSGETVHLQIGSSPLPRNTPVLAWAVSGTLTLPLAATAPDGVLYSVRLSVTGVLGTFVTLLSVNEPTPLTAVTGASRRFTKSVLLPKPLVLLPGHVLTGFNGADYGGAAQPAHGVELLYTPLPS